MGISPIYFDRERELALRREIALLKSQIDDLVKIPMEDVVRVIPAHKIYEVHKAGSQPVVVSLFNMGNGTLMLGSSRERLTFPVIRGMGANILLEAGESLYAYTPMQLECRIGAASPSESIAYIRLHGGPAIGRGRKPME